MLAKALILGIVQGITEFLPVSSTAHLILFPWVFGWNDAILDSLTFDVALHFGTLIAVLVYFRRDWVRLILAFFSSIRNMRISSPDERLIWLIIVATVPAAVLGAAFENYVENALRSPLIIVFSLALVSVLMVLAERAVRGRPGKEMEDMGAAHAIIIGLAQATALIPGVSRSGSTITAGLWSGYRRDEAARFSFLLSTPVIAGACVLKLRHLLGGLTHSEAAAFGIGMAAAAASGYVAIAFLISYLSKRPLYMFAGYRVILAVGILALYALR